MKNLKEGANMKNLPRNILFVLSLFLLAGCATEEKQPDGETQTQLEITTQAEAVVTTESEEIEAEPETEQKDQVALDKGIEIQKSSKRIPNDLANKAFKEIKEQISASNEGISNCENFELVISSEQKKDGLIWEKLWVYYDLIPAREPEEIPFLIGMKQARDKIDDTEQLKRVDEEIDGWYKEFEGNYQQKKEEPNMWLQMWLVYDPDGEDYTIYCETTPDGRYQLVTLEEYIEQHTENYELEVLKGEEYVMQVIADFH